jgi:hypothetical protein
MKLSELYTEHLANWISSGKLILRDRISSLGIKASFDRILTKKYVTKIWAITSVPVEYDETLITMIRKEMFKIMPDVKTVVQMVSVPTNVNVTSDTFKRQLRIANDQYSNFREMYENLNSADKLTGKTVRISETKKFVIRQSDVKRWKDRYDSFTYVYDHSTKGGEFVKNHIFIHASAENNKDINRYKKELTSLLNGRGIYFNEVRGNVSKYLANFGPASYIQEDVKEFQSSLMSDENLSHLSTYKTRGLVGGDGILMGVDWLSHLPFILNFFASPAAQIAMFVAESGQGKTLAAQASALAFCADGHHCSAVDIKGGEWEKLKHSVPLVVISMDDKNPRFVNTLRFDDMGATTEDSTYVYRTAVNGTIQLMAIMVNLQVPLEGNPTDLEFILEQAIVKVLDEKGVIATNPNTFVKTKDLKYEMVLDVISVLKSAKAFTEDQEELCSRIVTRCYPYFKSEGRYSEAFKNEISVGEVLETPLVIYSFNKNNNSMLDTLDTIRVFMVQYLDVKKQHIRKQQKLHTIAYYEELQRSDQFGKLLTFISHSVTGSRSNNVTIFLLLNALSIFNNPETKPIKSNISTVICGKIKQEDLDILVKDFNCEDIVPYVNAISFKEDNNFRNCFAAKFDNGVTVDKALYKVVLPAYMEEELRTRDVVVSS